jgi:transposase
MPLEARRLEAGRLLLAGQLSQADIARAMGVTRMAVSNWAKRLQEPQGDLRSVTHRLAPGRPPQLASEPWQQVLQWLKQSAGRSAASAR